MAGPTRRTHIVRIYGKNADGSKDKGTFADIEVLDAIAFGGTGGKAMVLNCPAAKADPYIVDDTGQNLGKSPDNGTRRSHVKKYTGSNGSILYAEVLDAIAFNDANGGEWILDTSSPTVFDTTDGSGDESSTRRGHDEKVPKPKSGAAPAKNSYVNVQRCDMVAFRSIMGREMIVKMPSADDGSGPRADTFIWNVPDYAPSDDPTKTPPPENTDPNFYIAFDQKGATPFMDDTKIQQGPLWWIRNLVSGGDYLVITMAGNSIDSALRSFGDSAFFNGNADAPDLFMNWNNPETGAPGTITTSPGTVHAIDLFSPYTITSADIAGKLTLSDGTKVSGFGLTQTNPALGNFASAVFFVKLADLGSGDIAIEIDTGAEEPFPVTLATLKKGSLHAGVVLDDIAGLQEDSISLPGGANWEFTVNTKTLKFDISTAPGATDTGPGPNAPPMP